jgi:RNA polymerase sigma factor (sigma-70 family)
VVKKMRVWRQREEAKRFEQLFLPHLNAAHNLARWLLKDAATAQDVVQESCLRAFSSQYQFNGGNARAWLLKIVRNQCYTWLQKEAGKNTIHIDDETTMTDEDIAMLGHTETPEKLVTAMQNAQRLHQSLDTLPEIFREVIILKEMEEFSYKEIAGITGVPIGTVMSRLARGRGMLRKELLKEKW